MILLNIMQNNETGRMELTNTIDNKANYYYITVEEFIEIAENLEDWEEIEYRIYEEVLDQFGLDINEYEEDIRLYDDPSDMWYSFKEAVEEIL